MAYVEREKKVLFVVRMRWIIVENTVVAPPNRIPARLHYSRNTRRVISKEKYGLVYVLKTVVFGKYVPLIFERCQTKNFILTEYITLAFRVSTHIRITLKYITRIMPECIILYFVSCMHTSLRGKQNFSHNAVRVFFTTISLFNTWYFPACMCEILVPASHFNTNRRKSR